MRNDDPVFELLEELSGQSSRISAPRILVELLDDDLKTAILLDQIVFWSGRTTDPDRWFHKTYDEWHEELRLSRHEVSTSISKLTAIGLVETKFQKVNGTPKNHYRLLRSPFRMWTCEKFACRGVKNSHVEVREIDTSYKEQKELTEGTEQNSKTYPVVPSKSKEKQEVPEVEPLSGLDETDLDLRDDVGLFCQNAYSRMGRRGKGLPKNLNSKANYQLLQRIQESESNVGQVEFRSGLLNFLSHENDYNRKNGWPIHGFIKDPVIWTRIWRAEPASRSAGNQTDRGRPAISRQEKEVVEPPSPPAIRPSAFDAMEIWNKIVGEASTYSIPCTNRFDRSTASALELDPDLSLELFESVCNKSLRLIETDPSIGSWLTLQWLAKEKDGMPGWAAIHRGKMDWKLKGDKSQLTSTVTKTYTEIARERMDKFMEERAKNANLPVLPKE